MNEASKRMSFSSRYPASRFSISRVASDTSLTTSNIVRAPKTLVAASPSAQRLRQYADDGLSSGQVSRTQQNDNAVAATLEYRHLAELGEVIHPGIRTRVRGENHALVEHYAYAVSHAIRLVCKSTLCSSWHVLLGCGRRAVRAIPDLGSILPDVVEGTWRLDIVIGGALRITRPPLMPSSAWIRTSAVWVVFRECAGSAAYRAAARTVR